MPKNLSFCRSQLRKQVTAMTKDLRWASNMAALALYAKKSDIILILITKKTKGNYKDVTINCLLQIIYRITDKYVAFSLAFAPISIY